MNRMKYIWIDRLRTNFEPKLIAFKTKAFTY